MLPNKLVQLMWWIWFYELSWTMILVLATGQRSDIEVEEIAKTVLMDCKDREITRFPEGRDAWYACWTFFLRWKSIKNNFRNLGAIHSPRIREGRKGSTPCLTARGLKL